MAVLGSAPQFDHLYKWYFTPEVGAAMRWAASVNLDTDVEHEASVRAIDGACGIGPPPGYVDFP
ncbi:MAG TPA: hypothetical protein VHM65_08945 [Candidatus Lustribacter sp.]|nr:hypothetical protein [Candidatus Lustribacter sp.]